MPLEPSSAIDGQPSEETVLGLDNIAVELPIAGLGSRVLAAMLDYALFSLVLFAGLVSAGLLTAAIGIDGGWAVAIVITSVFLLDWGYFAGQEMFNRGRTLGKMAVGLRAVGRRGEVADRSRLLLRNLLRTVDLFAGVPLMAIDPLARRLGDRVAGTVVVHERANERSLQVGRVPATWGPAEVAVVESFLRRAPTMEPARARSFGRRLLELVRRDAPEWLDGLEGVDPELALRRALAVTEEG